MGMSVEICERGKSLRYYGRRVRLDHLMFNRVVDQLCFIIEPRSAWFQDAITLASLRSAAPPRSGGRDGMKAEEAKRLKELEIENKRLKKLLAEAQLDKEILKEALEGNYRARRGDDKRSSSARQAVMLRVSITVAGCVADNVSHTAPPSRPLAGLRAANVRRRMMPSKAFHAVIIGSTVRRGNGVAAERIIAGDGGERGRR